MSGDRQGRALVDPYGQPLTVDTLPPSDTVRWVPKRKAQVVSAIRGGLITRKEACDRYSISTDELLSWEKLFDEHGTKALRVTKAQRYRQLARATRPDPE
jgi:hypothetical protein